MFSPFSQNELRFTDPNIANSEPMALGSPVSSPKSKGTPSQNYLPPYLFGEMVTSPVGTATWNTPKQHNISFPAASFPSPITPISHMREQVPFQSPVPSSIMNSPSAAKSGGPPIQGLLYSSTTTPHTSFDVTKLNVTPRTTDGQERLNFSGVLTPSKTYSVNNTSLLSPAQIDPFFTQGDALKNSEQLDESWVTVFGFPPASATYILQQFSQYGNIIEHKISPSGNWMHIRYQSKLQAKKALSKNGKIFSGNIMIGVKPCIEMDLMESTKENSLLETSEMQDSFRRDDEPTKPNLKNIRPLTQAYQSPNTQTQAIQQKPAGIVSKAMQYIWKL